MRKLLLILILVLMGAGVSLAQDLKDKIYYNEDWYVVKKASDASYYRLYNASDKSEGPKPYRDYYITGELQNEGTYISIDPIRDKNTIFEGVSTLYYKNGNKKSIWTYEKGFLQGYYAEFDSTGVMLEEGNYVKDEKDGRCYMYYITGEKSSDLFYVDGLLEGKQLKYSDGRVVGEAYYEDGLCKKEMYFNSNTDSLSSVYTFMDYNDDFIIANKTIYFNKDENPKISKVSIDLVYDFQYEILYYQFPSFALYNIEKDREEQICFEHGKFQEFDHEGRLLRDGERKLDKRVGIWKRYYYDQNFYRAIDYDSEAPDRYYTLDGEVFNGTFVLYHPNGKILSSNSVKDGLLDGAYYENDSLGRKIEEGFYKKGVLDGENKRYQYDEDDMEPFIIKTANITDGNFEGAESKWLHDGEWETIEYKNYKNGERDGFFQSLEGDSLIICTYKNGVIDGDYSINLIRNATEILDKTYRCVTRGQYKDGNKIGHWWRQRYRNDIYSQEEGDYVNDEREGEWIVYAPYQVSKDEEARQVILVLNYHNGLREGKAVQFKYKDEGPFQDSVACIMYYKNGKGEGPFVMYDNDGRVTKKGNLSDDKEIGEWFTYFYDQKVYYVLDYDNRNVPQRFYTLDGKAYTGNVIVNYDETDDAPAHTTVYTVKKSLIQRIDYVSTRTGKLLGTDVYKNGLLVE